MKRFTSLIKIHDFSSPSCERKKKFQGILLEIRAGCLVRRQKNCLIEFPCLPVCVFVVVSSQTCCLAALNVNVLIVWMDVTREDFSSKRNYLTITVDGLLSWLTKRNVINLFYDPFVIVSHDSREREMKKKWYCLYFRLYLILILHSWYLHFLSSITCH